MTVPIHRLPREKIIAGYTYFVGRYNDGAYQFARLRVFFDLLEEGKSVPLESKGYGNFWLFARMVPGNRAAGFQPGANARWR